MATSLHGLGNYDASPVRDTYVVPVTKERNKEYVIIRHLPEAAESNRIICGLQLGYYCNATLRQ